LRDELKNVHKHLFGEKNEEKKRSRNVKRVSIATKNSSKSTPDANKSFPILPNIHKDNKNRREVRKLVLVILKLFFFILSSLVAAISFILARDPKKKRNEKKMFNFNPLLSASNEIKIKQFLR
jgi:hypothetical protein